MADRPANSTRRGRGGSGVDGRQQRSSGSGQGGGGGRRNLDDMLSATAAVKQQPGMIDDLMRGKSNHGVRPGGRTGRGVDMMFGGTAHTANTMGTAPTFATSSVARRGGTRQQQQQSMEQRGPFDFLPEDFIYHPSQASPILYFLPRLVAQHQQELQQQQMLLAASGTGGAENLANLLLSGDAFLSLDALLHSAEEDTRLHRARVKAGLEKDNRLLRTYQLENDQLFQARQKRLAERSQIVSDLQNNARQILANLYNENSLIGLTQSERTQAQVQKWQRALELYVYAHEYDVSPPEGGAAAPVAAATTSTTGGDGADEAKTAASTAAAVAAAAIPADLDLEPLDWQSVLQTLLEGVTEDQEISPILAQASDLCSELVLQTEQAVRDAAQTVIEVEQSYRIRLQAHSHYGRSCLAQVGEISNQFTSSGQAALHIGHQLEQAEQKRAQCEAASTLIRRWWMMETLAEQEQNSGQLLDVEKEVSGKVPIHACKMDPLFTMPEHSLEAAQTLQSLRAVVRSRGSAAASSGVSDAKDVVKANAPTNSRRLDATASLLARTSTALEQRLLTTFETCYASGGHYDFSPKPRPGAMDWRTLRALAKALLLFDSGRQLHQRYVDMVVELRFPELFKRKPKLTVDEGNPETIAEESEDESDEDGDGDHKRNKKAGPSNHDDEKEFDIDETRSQLSSLFHRVSDVCTQELELIARVFGSHNARTNLMDGNEEMPLVVARALLQRVISDPVNGLQARIHHLLSGIDKLGDFEAGAKKIDTFVVIHEKAAGLFGLLRDAAENMIPDDDYEEEENDSSPERKILAARAAVESLKGFLTSQELALSNAHRQGYINLELRLLHHECCNSLDQAGCTLVKGPPPRPNLSLIERGLLEEYRAPVLPLHKETLASGGFNSILAGPLKQSVLRQPLIHATDSLSRARLMFGTSHRGGETTARVILSIYSQMCSFYGEGLLYPIMETLKEMLPNSAPSQPPTLPFDEEQEAPDLGVPPSFWVALERVHSASKSFDRELWAEQRTDSATRVWGTLQDCNDAASMAIARDERLHFYSELERRGEASILQALDTLSAHVSWVLVTGGESMLATGGTRIFNQLTGQSGGPYAIPSGASLETPNSPAVKSLTYCLRVQFVHVQSALTAASLAKFWTALSMRLYDILVARLLQHYLVSTVGAVILSRDVEALRSVAMLAGTEHEHWDTLRELLTLYMTPPDAIKIMLTGPEGDATKGLFAKAGRDQCLVFMSRRNDYRYKTAAGLKKSGWVTEMLKDLKMSDPTDGPVNIGMFAAGRSKFGMN